MTKSETLYKKLDNQLAAMNSTPELDEAIETLGELIIAKISELENDLENMTSEKEEQYDRAESLEEALNDCGEKLDIYDQLKDLSSSYQLNDSNNTLQDILNLLEDEFNLKLVALPGKNT